MGHIVSHPESSFLAPYKKRIKQLLPLSYALYTHFNISFCHATKYPIKCIIQTCVLSYFLHCNHTMLFLKTQTILHKFLQKSSSCDIEKQLGTLTCHIATLSAAQKMRIFSEIEEENGMRIPHCVSFRRRESGTTLNLQLFEP